MKYQGLLTAFQYFQYFNLKKDIMLYTISLEISKVFSNPFRNIMLEKNVFLPEQIFRDINLFIVMPIPVRLGIDICWVLHQFNYTRLHILFYLLLFRLNRTTQYSWIHQGLEDQELQLINSWNTFQTQCLLYLLSMSVVVVVCKTIG